MEVSVKSNKSYKKVHIVDSNVFQGYVENYEVPDEILRKLSKDLGFSYDLYTTLYNMDKEAATTMVSSMSLQSKHTDITLLVEEEEKKVLDYTLDIERTPLLNSDFISRVCSMVDACDKVTLSEIYYHKDDTISSVIVRKIDPIIIEEKYVGEESKEIEYHIGILLVNNEIDTTYSRLVLYLNDQPLYLPASYYNSTTSRFRRSTKDSLESLELLVLKIIEDLRENALYDKLYELHFKYRANKDILASYEEYNTLLRTMRKIPTIIEEPAYLDRLLTKSENFEQLYAHVEEQKSSYIWRCTALGDMTVGALLSISCQILNDVGASAIEYYSVRELLGSYVSTNRIAKEIARADMQE